ncbi:MAG: 4-hydroxybenzoate 3-monooxygenase [Alphaproteobacteria bacterium]
MRTQVAIIGAGPAGLFLAHILNQSGIACIVLERRTRAYVQDRVRAGVLERVTVDLLEKLGLGARMRREGLAHGGTNIVVDGRMFRIDFAELTGGATIMVYGQQEVMKDLGEGADARGLQIIYNAEEVKPQALDSDTPFVTYVKDGKANRIDCDFVVGCDGYHGVARQSIPARDVKTFERVFPFGWLGILADVPPGNDELIYATHENGFALSSMRSPTRSRYYLQVSLDQKIEDWPDERFWDELCIRLGAEASAHLTRGKSFEKSIAPLRSFVCETMRWNRLFLAGDAAHIVPPTGAKGLNLAVSDAIYLAEAFDDYYRCNSSAGIDHYAARALARVWQAERFSWWFTSLTHRFPTMDGFDRKMQVAEIEYIRTSRAAQTTLAENYVGLPLR